MDYIKGKKFKVEALLFKCNYFFMYSIDFHFIDFKVLLKF